MMPSQERVTQGQPFTRDIIFIFIDLWPIPPGIGARVDRP